MFRPEFQDFSAPSAPVVGDGRLKKLRAHMKELAVDVVIVPHNDEQNNEYLPADKERLAWLSGFTGSAGFALVSQQAAWLFVDGRYSLQASEQVDPVYWQREDMTAVPASVWIEQHMKDGAVFAYDPWLHSPRQVEKFAQAVEKTGCQLVALSGNPVDAVWQDRPLPPKGPVKIHELEFSGRLTSAKLEAMQAELVAANVDLCVLTNPSSVCWLFNIRGGDVAHTPIVLAHAIIRADEEPLLFIDDGKLDIETRAYLTQVSTLCDPEQLQPQLTTLSRDARVMLDPDLAPAGFSTLVEAAGGMVVAGKDPASLPRATKNPVEIQGSRNAHLRDGAAMTSFFAWLDNQPPGTVDEITAAKRLEQIRYDMAVGVPLRDISFDTISGSGPHGAIVHYRVNADSNRILEDGDLYLCDSGGQYDDGTTDITRTVPIGQVGAEERRIFTLVLRGLVNLTLARFPKGTRGRDLDPIARMPLWQNGLDYAHGTGHGVGSYLSVHEGPQNISKRGTQEILPGMITSNEPGCYQEGKFGIRIENLIVFTQESDIEGGSQTMLGSETLTLCPIDRRLIDASMLTDEELQWLNDYHARVRRKLEPLVSADVADWLCKATEPLRRK